MRDTGHPDTTRHPSCVANDWEDEMDDTMTVTVGGLTSGLRAVRDSHGFWRPVVALLDPATGAARSDVVDGRVSGEAHESVRACLLAAVGRVP